MQSSGDIVYSADGSFALVEGTTRRVLKLNITNSDGVAGFGPQNLKGNVTLKPGHHFEWIIKSIAGDKADLQYRTQLADATAEALGFKGEDGWVLNSLPANYEIFVWQKGQADANGKEKLARTDSYLFGHPSGLRFPSPAEFAPHLLGLIYQNQDSLSGQPRNHRIKHDPLYTCECQHCAKEAKKKAAMSESSVKRAAKSAAIKANATQAKIESIKDIKDGGWKFRLGELVWAFQRSDTAQLGGVWFAAVVVSNPESTSYADVANLYSSIESGRGLYRVQKCGSDSTVLTIHTGDILPWLKIPQAEVARNTAVDSTSADIGRFVASGVSNINPVSECESFEDGSQHLNVKGLFLGPEKIWINDAIRINRTGGPSADISIWDPKQYDVMIVRRIFYRFFVVAPDQMEDPNAPSGIWYFQGDVLTMYPGANDKVVHVAPDCVVPNYIKNIGTSYPPWMLRSPPGGRLATISSAYVLGRFYDPRMIGLMEKRWETIDSVIVVDRYIHERAHELGLMSINGEPIRHSGAERTVIRESTESLFGEGARRDMLTPAERASLAPGDVMTDRELEEYRQRSGGLSNPKSLDTQDYGGYPQQKKRRTD